MASCDEYLGEFVITWYSFPSCISNFPSRYSSTAVFPVLSVIARCKVEAEPLGIWGASIRNISFLSSSTASRTVAKLSSTYCVQILIPITGRLSPRRLYTDSGRNKRLATNPFSFIPSHVPMSYPVAMTLPYFEVHVTVSPLLYPALWIPLGKTYRLLMISSFQSMVRPVTIRLSGPMYTARVHASIRCMWMDSIMVNAISAMFFVLIFLY